MSARPTASWIEPASTRVSPLELVGSEELADREPVMVAAVSPGVLDQRWTANKAGTSRASNCSNFSLVSWEGGRSGGAGMTSTGGEIAGACQVPRCVVGRIGTEDRSVVKTIPEDRGKRSFLAQDSSFPADCRFHGSPQVSTGIGHSEELVAFRPGTVLSDGGWGAVVGKADPDANLTSSAETPSITVCPPTRMRTASGGNRGNPGRT